MQASEPLEDRLEYWIQHLRNKLVPLPDKLKIHPKDANYALIHLNKEYKCKGGEVFTLEVIADPHGVLFTKLEEKRKK